MNRLAVPTLGLAVLGRALHAQPDYVEYPPVPYPQELFLGRHFPFTPGCDGSSFTNTAAADATADAIPDLFLRYGANAYVCEDPIDHAAIKLVATGVNDFALVPGVGWEGSHALATVGSGGLELWKFDASVTPSPSAVQWTSTTIDSSTCANAKLVAVGDMDADGDDDLIVVLADTVTIQIYVRSTTTQGAAVYTAGASQTTAYAIQDIELVRWGSAGTRLIAALDSYGLDLYGGALTMVEHLRGNQGGSKPDAFAIVRTSSGVDESIAWVDQAAATGNQQELHVVKAGYVETDIVALHVSSDTGVPAGVVGIAAADRNGDGLTDLAFSVKSSRDLLLLMGQTSGAMPFTSAEAGDFEHVQADFTPPDTVGSGINSTNKAAVVWQDLNNDGLLDLARPSNVDCIVTVIRGVPQVLTVYGDDPGLQGWYRPDIDYPGNGCSGCTYPPGWEYEFKNTLRFELDPQWSPGEFDQLELTVWAQAWPSSAACPSSTAIGTDTYLDAVSLVHSIHDIENGAIQPHACVDVPIYVTPECERYYIELRAVNTDVGPSGNLRVTSAGPKHVYGFARIGAESSTLGNPGDMLFALPDAQATPGMPHYQYTLCCPNNGGINGSAGVLLKTPHTPGFGPNVTPRPGAVATSTAFAH